MLFRSHLYRRIRPDSRPGTDTHVRIGLGTYCHHGGNPMTPLAIAATGACTPIGTRAWQTASVLAAKQSAFTRVQLPDHIDHLATVSRVSAIPSDETGTDRLIRLAAPALAEVMPSDTRTHTSQQPIMLFLAVPSSMQELPLHCDPQRIARSCWWDLCCLQPWRCG